MLTFFDNVMDIVKGKITLFALRINHLVLML